MVAEGAHGGGGGMFADLLLIFATALVMVAACRPARLPGTLGYFAAGALLGPTGLGLIHAGADIQLLAEFGVVLLLFSLGLEFSLPRLMAMRRSVFGVGLLQVAVTGALFALALGLGYVDWGLAVLIGAAPEATAGPVHGDHADVLLLGYGRVGQTIGRLLERCGIDHIALDSEPGRVNAARLAGAPVRFGDATRPDLLEMIGVDEAQLVVVCIDDPEAARQALSAVRELAPTVPVLVRTREDTHLDELMAAGATEVVPETLESSFMILSHVLALLGRPRRESEQVLEAVRGERYQLLHGVITGTDEEGRYEEIVRPVLLPARARAIGETLTDLEDRLGPVSVRGVRRREVTLDPDSAGPLRADDIVILVGAPDAVELGETVLLGG